jgi:hypothetical protein
MPGRYTEPKRHQFVQLKDGVVVERDVLNIVQRISEYDPNLSVKYLDPDRVESAFDAPYIIVELCPDGVERIVTSVWELNEQVLEMIKHADLARHVRPQDLLAEMDRHNAKIKEQEKKRQFAEAEALGEMVADVLRSPKDTYTASNPLTGQKHKFTATPQ